VRALSAARMQTENAISGLAHTIQLAVAPVFLLTGVGSFLNVLTSRLARIIDRSRALEGMSADAHAAAAAVVLDELRVLRRRSELINRAIGMCTYSALLVAGTVATLFVGAFLRLDLSTLVAVAFVASMLALITGLTNFLGEVHLATRQLREQGRALERSVERSLGA
jgi:hypothetical protein